MLAHLALLAIVLAADGPRPAAASSPPSARLSPATGPAAITVLGRSQTRSTTSPRDDSAGVIVGTLLFTRVRAQITDAPVSEALRAFEQALALPVVPLYAQQPGDPGLDPGARVTVELEDATALEALEAIVAAAMQDGGSWQITRGRLEVGPKWILARPSARTCVVLPARDLLLEPPDFGGVLGVGEAAGAAIFSGSLRRSISERFPDAVTHARAGRSTPEFVASQLIAEIESKVEPEAWLVDEAQRAWLLRTGEAGNPLARAGQWAALTHRDGFLVVTAPDFVLRGIRGYEGVVPPAVGAVAPSARVLAPDEPVVVAAERARVELLGFAPGDRGAHRRDSGPERSDPALVSLGRLVHSRVNVTLAGASARIAFESLAAATGASIRPIWATQGVAGGAEQRVGMDAETPLHLELANASGLEALEYMLELAGAECTWQLAGGVVECGPKSQLARTGVRRRALYDVASLLVEPPYSMPGDGEWIGVADIVTPLEQQFGRELGFERSGRGKRKSARFIAAEMLLLLEKHVEPRGWLPSDEQLASRVARGRREVDPLDRQGEWVHATYLDGKFVVTAPDFVHRAIRGYPPLPSPADVDRATRPRNLGDGRP